MKQFIIKYGLLLVLLIGITSCGKDALRTAESQQQLDAIEDVNDPFLLSSIIKKTALFYQNLNYGDSRFPGAVQYMERNYQGGDNTYTGFSKPAEDLYTAVDILKLVQSS